MPRSIAAVAVPLLLLACAETSQPPVVTAPSASAGAATPATSAAAPPATTAAPPPTASVPPPAASAGTTGPAPVASTNVPAQYRACNTDADCLAVPRAGCCPHGWKEAIAAPQKDAYARDFACAQTPRPICPLFLVRDARVAKCDAKAHLCEMVQP